MGERFGEPWGIRKTTGFDLIKADGGWIGSVTATHEASAPEVAERVRDCVNAMTGIPDPAATMKEVVEVLCAVLNAHEIESPRGKLPLVPDALDRARALLAKLGRG